ncbi:hypothetical protein IFM89_021602 [Coptis chinensis]|uniref:Stress-response A/B barrel domain-containing protein n=1 Tax=Coptis chinensis TaxID=261450 RepID=A0A835IBZ7_9MAGN|nr:hypothetical protein IFM89_021602 [Coptis chinensis]
MSQIIKHIVLVKIKDITDPSKINSMINTLHALNSLDGVLHLTAGPIHTIRSPSSNFSHMLHGRMVLYWVAGLHGPIVPRVGAVMHVSFLKLQGELEQSGKGEVLKIVGEIKDHFGSIVQITFGENFSPAKAKGFSITSLVKEQNEKVRDLLESIIIVDYVIHPPQYARLSKKTSLIMIIFFANTIMI